MRRIALLNAILAIAIPSVFSGQSLANTRLSQSRPPLELTVTRVDKTAWGQGLALDLNIRNVSQKCVIGFVIDKQFSDANGRKMMGGSESSVRHSKNGGFECLAPGEVFHWPHGISFPTSASGEAAAKYAFTVDYVVFSDQSTWGPGRNRYEDGRVDGMIETYTTTDRRQMR
jgi:hypothetical protein